MAERKLRVLQVNMSDRGGGAAMVAYNLLQLLQARGHESWLAVRHKRTESPNVIPIPVADYEPTTNRHRRLWRLRKRLMHKTRRVPGAGRLRFWLAVMAGDPLANELSKGWEGFHHPGSHCLLGLTPHGTDVIHLHNLYRGYFDLRLLPRLSQSVPAVVTLHDSWLLTGHCAHSLGCDRWATGCGHCPDLRLYPEVRRDATAENWRRKRDIYAESRLYVVTPSTWLLNRVLRSMLRPAIVEACVIPNGVDLTVFRPGDKASARDAVNIPQDRKVLLYVATHDNRYKDYQTIEDAVSMVASRLQDKRCLLVALGSSERPSKSIIGGLEFLMVSHQSDRSRVARYYQAADIYIHAAQADTFPTVILEALACGVPVIATAVGGIPEQVNGLQEAEALLGNPGLNEHDLPDATGILVPQANAHAMATCIIHLMDNEKVRRRLSANAARDARERFDLESQVDAYVGLYEHMIADRAA